jgi:hypothetical protein
VILPQLSARLGLRQGQARDVVAIVGAAEAEKMARDAGASEARIAAAKRCLTP